MGDIKMSKYIIGYNFSEYEKINIEDVYGILENMDKTEEVEFIIIMDKIKQAELFDYYNAISSMLKKNVDTFLIYTSGNNEWKPLAMLMASYDRWDVYRAETIDSINTEYLKNIEKRRPTYREESIVNGADIVGYNKIGIIVLGIANLVKNKDTEGIKKFISQYENEIDGIVMALDYMKSIVDKSNKSELERQLDNKEKENLELYGKIVEFEKEKKLTAIELRDLKKSFETTKEKLRIAEGKVITAEAVNEAGATGSVTDYPELNTMQLNSKIGRVIYFKEISSIPYMNSFVWALVEQLKIYKVKIKLIIYDYDFDKKNGYDGIPVCDSKEFINNKRNLVEKTEKLVMTEPNPTVISEIARCLPAYEVVIIYDKMHRKKDVITGSTVKKFYVCNSKNDYDLGCKDFGIKKVEDVFMLSGSTLGGKYLDIQKIDNYSLCTNNAKISKYMKSMGSRTGESIAKTVLTESHVMDILKQKGVDYK